VTFARRETLLGARLMHFAPAFLIVCEDNFHDFWVI
jgi:hypothetical protein